MANLFSSIIAGAKDSITSPLAVVKDLGKGDFSGAFKNLKHIPGNQERANSDILRSVGIRGKVGENPIMIPAAIFGGIYGAGAAGLTGGAGAGAGASGFSGVGGSGIGAYMAPTAASSGTGVGALGGSVFNPGTIAGMTATGSGTGASGAALGTGINAGTALGGSAGFGTGATSAGSVFNAGAGTGALGEVAGGAGASGASGTGFNMQQMARVLNSVKPPEQERQQINMSGGVQSRSGGFNFNRKDYENPLLTKAYADLYTRPLS